MNETARVPRRGDIWLITMVAARRGELGKSRPAVVVSIDELSTGSPVDHITIIPLSASRSPAQLRPAVPRHAGLDRDCVAICDFPRAFVPSRFVRYLGTVPDDVMARIIRARAVIEGWDGV